MNRPVNRLGLLALQILVGLVGLAIWHVLTVYPILGAPSRSSSSSRPRSTC